MNKPKILIFANAVANEHFEGIAVTEDGHVLTGHLSSSESFMKYDMGLLAEDWSGKNKIYAERYPEGYELVYIPPEEVKDNELIKKSVEFAKSRGDF